MTILSHRHWEIGYPYVAAGGITAVWYFSLDAPFPDDTNPLLGASVTVASVFGGFLGASKAIVLAIRETAVFEVLRKSGYVNDLYNYLNSGILWSIGFLLISIIGFFFTNNQITPKYQKYLTAYQAAWLFTCGISLFCYLRVSRILFKLLKHT